MQNPICRNASKRKREASNKKLITGTSILVIGPKASTVPDIIEHQGHKVEMKPMLAWGGKRPCGPPPYENERSCEARRGVRIERVRK